jgi:hypothetical protein
LKRSRRWGAETAYLDGELCGIGDDGLPSFSQTQAATDGSRGVRLVYFVFDLPCLDGRDTNRNAPELFIQRSDLFMGGGLTTRKNCEFVILGKRGRPERLATDVREVILSRVREPSRKPDEAYSRIERYCTGPRLELFARESRANWTSWGDEAAKFDPSKAAAIPCFANLHRESEPAP